MSAKSAKSKKISDFEEVRRKLKLKNLKTQSDLHKKYPTIKKLTGLSEFDISKVRERSANILGAGIVTGSIILGLPKPEYHLPAPHELIEYVKSFGETKVELDEKHKVLSRILNSTLPDKPRPLTRNEEKFLESVFGSFFDFKIKANLEGEHLNTTYGYVGLEQHLKRYPGDNLSQHTEGKARKAGMAPGLGAWGYFANSKDGLTPDLVETEKWYAVVQTLYLPDWNTRQPHLKNWYKYRKVLIVNPENGNSVVASIADSGPAAWTGKHFGASPETMLYLGGDRYTKGKVILFFVDDPENDVPLGPVEYGRIAPTTFSEVED